MNSCLRASIAILHRLPGLRYASIAAVVAAALLPATVQGEIYSYHVAKTASYTQTDAAPPATPNSWLFTGILYYSAEEVLSASIAFDVPPPTTVEMYEAAETTHLFYSNAYASQEDLDLAYPSTTYTFTADLVGGPESADVFLPVDLYSAEIPYFTGDTYDRLQSYDVSQPFDVFINGFTLPLDANVGATDVYVKEEGGATAFSVSIAPDETYVQIPAGLLLPSVNYSISVQYASLLETDNAGFGTATSGAGFYRGTAAYFTTLPDSIPCGSWTVINLHPAGLTDSYVWSVEDGQQVGGTLTATGDFQDAILWSGTAESWVNLTPPGATFSYAWGLDAGQQAGAAIVDGAWHASLWSGTAESWVDLNPAGSPESYITAMDSGQQAGQARVDGDWRAGLWTGTAGSWVDLDPPGTSLSYCYGVDGGQQAGTVLIDDVAHASLWIGTADSWVDLSPAGSDASACYGVGDGQQVGLSVVGGVWHAGYWTGTAESWVDMHPAGTDSSVLLGADGGRQVGETSIADVWHAGVWSGTAPSWVDLHAFLPAEFTASYGRGIWNDGATTYVVGFGFNSTTGYYEALMWVSGASCLGDMNCDGVVNSADAPLFVEAMLTPATYTGCDITRGDMNQDTFIDGDDTQLFVNAIAVP